MINLGHLGLLGIRSAGLQGKHGAELGSGGDGAEKLVAGELQGDSWGCSGLYHTKDTVTPSY